MSQNIFDSSTCTYIYPKVHVGKNVKIDMFCLVGVPLGSDEQETYIGDDCSLGPRTTIYAGATLRKSVLLEGDVTISSVNEIGEGCRIGPASVLRHSNKIGKNVRIHSHAFLERTLIGDNVFIAPHVVFADDMHPPCPEYARCTPETRVESFVSIGANSVIGPGVTIGHHSQIYAGAVVVRDVAPFSVMAGNPARKIHDIRELECKKGFFEKPFQWWDG